MSAVSAGGSLVFIDTSIWLNAFSDSQDRIKTQLARILLRRTREIVLSTQVVNEVAVNLLRKFQVEEQDICPVIRSFY